MSSTTARHDEVGVFLKQTGRKELPAAAPASSRRLLQGGRADASEMAKFRLLARGGFIGRTTPGNVLEPVQVPLRRLLWPRLLCAAPAGLRSADTAALNI